MSCLFGLAVYTGYAAFAPTEATEIIVREPSEGLTIRLQKNSPPYAALEELEEKIDNDWQATGVQVAAIPSAATPQSEPSYEKNPVVFHLSRAEEPASQQETLVAGEQSVRPALQAAGYFQPKFEVAMPIERKVSLQDLKISREELLRALFFPMAGKSVPAELPTPQRPRGLPLQPVPTPSQPEQPPPPTPSGWGKGLAKNTDNNGAGIRAAGQEFFRQLVISGRVQMEEGLAMTQPTEQLVVFHENLGQPHEQAEVSRKDARFQILVDQAEGALQAELRNVQGDVLGRGRMEMSNLANWSRNGRQIQDVVIKMKPVVSGMVGVALAAQSRQAMDKVEVELDSAPLRSKTAADGEFQMRELHEGSTGVVVARQAGHWDTLQVAATGQKFEVPMFSDERMTAIVHAVGGSPSTPAEMNAAIWGRVTRAGAAVAGARVELVTGDTELKPVYFNQMQIPDSTLQETSENGLYMFVHVTAGIHAVVAHSSYGDSEPVIIPAAAKAVSRAMLEVRREMKADVRVFDAFQPDVGLPAYIVNVGEKQGQEIDNSGTGIFKLAAGDDLMFLDVDGGQAFVNQRMGLSRDRRSFFVPLIRRSWMDEMLGRYRFNMERGTGIVVGFVQSDRPYKVFLNGQDPAQMGIKVAYFDRQGGDAGDKEGVVGGGFVIFNMPEGLRTVTVSPRESEKLLTRAVLIDSGTVNVITHWFR